MKNILGLDLGTNSIGWALVETDENNNPSKIAGMGSRIIPMGSDKKDYENYEKGATITKNANRRAKRSTRRMGKRYKVRRNKLLYILAKLEMLPEQFQFKSGFPIATKIQDLELLPIRKHTMQLDSLEHYTLRTKALQEKIDLKDFGKILYHYNRLRGYSGGGENDDDDKNKEKSENDDKKYEVRVQKFTIKSVEDSGTTYKVRSGKDAGKKLPIYNITVIDDDTEIIGTTKLQGISDKVDSEIELEIRIKRTKKGENISFALPQKTNWRKQMEETELLLKEKNYFPCQLFAEELIKNKWTKIRRRVILRQQYKREFDAIWEEQAKHYPILKECPHETLKDIVNYIFPGSSESQNCLREQGLKYGLKYIIKEQVIYYQRPLKSQEDHIATCQFEKDEKVIPTSHPLFQEFRCWDQINRLFIRSKRQAWNDKKKKFVLQYQNRYLTDEQKLSIYSKLQEQKTMSFSEVAKAVNLASDNTEFLNGLHVKAKLLGCDTLISIKKLINDTCDPSADIIKKIWEAVYYNVHEGSEYDENSKRVRSITEVLPNSIDISQRKDLSLNIAQKIKFNRKYASLSKKAIEHIIPLMRLHPDVISESVQNKFENIKNLIETGEVIDDGIPQDYIIEYVKDNPNALEQGGIMYAFASSLVYGRHTSEKIEPQIKDYHEIKYTERNLRNPIVEQIVNETMQVVKSLWKQFHLNPEELEIRVELARDLKNSAKEREKIFKGQTDSRRTNEAIKKKLIELNQEVNDRNIELYKIWSRQENARDENGNPLSRPKFKNADSPTADEIEKMRLWEEQHFVSPYTLAPIPLSKLFSPERIYDIDHIIPKSRYFDNSIANKVVCESSVNEEKGNRTAWEYISQQDSQYNILTPENYLNHVNNIFHGQKKKFLLAEKIPSNPVSRQLKDTQYISVAVKKELAKIVGSDNVKTTTGVITDYLRSQWGLKRFFMELTEPRFKQMELWDTNEEGKPNEAWIKNYFDKQKQKHIYEIKGWSKRFDHRHHSIDALIVALCNEKYIKRLNDLNKYFQDELSKFKTSIPMSNEDSLEEAFFNLSKEKRESIMKEIESSRKFNVPYDNLVAEAKHYLETMIVSQKPKDKLAIKDDTSGIKQLKIRAALHQETFYGKTNGRDTKTVSLSEMKAKDIPLVIDEVLRREINAHRKKYDSMREAFTGEGLIAFNDSRFQTKNKTALKPPVYKVKLWYSNKEKETGNLQPLYGLRSKKSVLTGDNYMFVVMEKEGKRVFDIASLYDSVALAKAYLKSGITDIEEIKMKICDDLRIGNNNGMPKADSVLFYLQHNDLVYMPKDDDAILNYNASELNEWLSDINNKKDFTKRIYKVVKLNDKDIFFIPNNYAKEISLAKDLSEIEKRKLEEKYNDKKIPKQELNFIEFGTYKNCTPYEMNDLFTKLMKEGKKYKGEKPRKIQDYCVKMKTDWLGNVTEFNGIKL